jgi:hypothetical protein
MIYLKRNLYKDTLSSDHRHREYRFIVEENEKAGMDTIWNSKHLFGPFYVKTGKPFRDYHGNFIKSGQE